MLKMRITLLGLIVLGLLTSGCAGLWPQTRMNFESLDREARDRAAGRMTEADLRQAVLRFANRYMSAVGAFGMKRTEDKTRRPDERLASLRLAHSLTTAALDIAIGPSPVVNLLDMMVLTSLTRRRAEAERVAGGFYRSEDLAAVVPTLEAVEKDIWALGARVLSPEQLSSLQGLIDEWLRENPGQGYVADVRLAAFAAEHDATILAEVWAVGFIPGMSLAPELDQASEAVDEMRVLLERYLVYFQHLPAIVRWESQQAYLQLILQPEVNQLLSSAAQAAASSDRIAGFLDRLPQEEEKLRALSADLRQTILAGREMAGLVDQAVVSADAFLVGMEERTTPGGRRFDIIDWQNTAVGIGVAAAQLDGAVAQINALVTSPGWEANLPELIAVLDRAESKTEEAVDHAFRQSLLLIAVFLGGSLLTALVYQWLKRKLFSPGTGSPAV
jgi:hypothetical protein